MTDFVSKKTHVKDKNVQKFFDYIVFEKKKLKKKMNEVIYI